MKTDKILLAGGGLALLYWLFSASKPKDETTGTNGLDGLTDKRLPGKSLAASQVLQLMDKDWEYDQSVKMVVWENTKWLSINKSKQFKAKLEKELNRYI